ncbi:hypothetical protein EON64_17545 [archaeon]|nr:MAG: hypothetical protein EON64_17545 [archaeon]
MQFYELFDILAYRRGWAAARQCSSADAKQYTATLCGEHLVPVRDFQVGHQKVFLKSEAFESMHRAVETFLGKKVRRFQGLVRKRIAMRRFGAAKRGVITLQNIIRMRICIRRFQKLLAISRAEEKARRELEQAQREAQEERERRAREEREQREGRERAFRARIISLHDAAARGDFAFVVEGLTANPEDYAVRDTFSPKSSHPSLLMSACLGGNLELVRYFSVTREELLQDKDSEGDSVLHYLMRGSKETSQDILRYFVDILCGDEAEEAATVQAVTAGKVRPLSTKISTVTASIISSSSNSSSGAAATGSKLSAAAPSGPIELRAGWLQKRGESQIWRRRFVRLTSHALMYFRSPRDKLPRDTLLLEVGLIACIMYW